MNLVVIHELGTSLLMKLFSDSGIKVVFVFAACIVTSLQWYDSNYYLWGSMDHKYSPPFYYGFFLFVEVLSFVVMMLLLWRNSFLWLLRVIIMEACLSLMMNVFTTWKFGVDRFIYRFMNTPETLSMYFVALALRIAMMWCLVEKVVQPKETSS